MKPTAHHVFHTCLDRPAVTAATRLQLELERPTRWIQRTLAAACVVAVGFITTNLVLRETCIVIAVIILAWGTFQDQLLLPAAALRAHPPGTVVEHDISTTALRIATINSDQTREETSLPWAAIHGLYTGASYWLLDLGSLGITTIDGHSLRSDEAEAARILIAKKTGQDWKPVPHGFAQRIRRAQTGRSEYLRSHRDLLERMRNSGRGQS